MNWYQQCKIASDWSWKRMLALPLITLAGLLGIDRLLLNETLRKHDGDEQAVKVELVQRAINSGLPSPVNISKSEVSPVPTWNDEPAPATEQAPPVQSEPSPDGITDNFSLREFASKDGATMPPEVQANITELARNLQILRDEVGKPITISSGYRSPEHNKSVGGARNSQHVRGTAADIQITGMSSKDIRDIIERLIDEGKMEQGGIGTYSSFVHYDIRGNRARW